MVRVVPSKALSVRVNSDMRLESKDKRLSFTDEVHVLPKLDGIYAIKAGGVLRTRTMAPYRKEIQEKFKFSPEGVCAELVVGNRFASDSWAKTTSDVSRKEGPTEAVMHMFDLAAEGSFASRRERLLEYVCEDACMIETLARLNVNLGVIESDPLDYAPQVGDKETLEGLVLRPASMAYTAGRSTAPRPFFMRIKGEETVDGQIVDVIERMHNANEAKETHDGKLRRHSFKENLHPTGLAGAIEVMLPNGRRVMVGTGFDMEQAAYLWNRREALKFSFVELKRHSHVRETLSGAKSEQGAYVFKRLRGDKK